MPYFVLLLQILSSINLRDANVPHLSNQNVINGMIANGMNHLVLKKNALIIQQKINVMENVNGKVESVLMRKKNVKICQMKKVVQILLDVVGKITNALNLLNVQISL